MQLQQEGIQVHSLYVFCLYLCIFVELLYYSALFYFSFLSYYSMVSEIYFTEYISVYVTNIFNLETCSWSQQDWEKFDCFLDIKRFLSASTEAWFRVHSEFSSSGFRMFSDHESWLWGVATRVGGRGGNCTEARGAEEPFKIFTEPLYCSWHSCALRNLLVNMPHELTSIYTKHTHTWHPIYIQYSLFTTQHM